MIGENGSYRIMALSGFPWYDRNNILSSVRISI